MFAQQAALAVGKQVGVSDLQDLDHRAGPGMLGDYLHIYSQVVGLFSCTVTPACLAHPVVACINTVGILSRIIKIPPR